MDEERKNPERELDTRATGPRITHGEVAWHIEATHCFTAAQGVASAALASGRTVGDMHESLSLITICAMVLRNGFVVIGKSACVSAANFSREIGERAARADAERQVWELMGYALRDRVFHWPRVQAAVAQLQVSIAQCDSNEPINRAAGNVEQANLEAQNSESMHLAIALLTP